MKIGDFICVKTDAGPAFGYLRSLTPIYASVDYLKYGMRLAVCVNALHPARWTWHGPIPWLE